MKPPPQDKRGKESREKGIEPSGHVAKAQQAIGLLTSETGSARRFAAALGNFGIQQSTLNRLTTFAQDGEEAFAKLLGVVHADAADQSSDPVEVDEILKAIAGERSWFLSVRASYEQMLRSKRNKKAKKGASTDELDSPQQQQQAATQNQQPATQNQQQQPP